MAKFAGKVAIVTGGATLIGEAVVKAFADNGANVVIADINAEGGTEVAERAGEHVSFHETDLRRDGDIKDLVAATAKAHGRIDYLINVACT